jgi:hypothetical protein
LIYEHGFHLAGERWGRGNEWFDPARVKSWGVHREPECILAELVDVERVIGILAIGQGQIE